MSLPYLISWNLTKRCNLKCDHCYLDASELSGTDLIDHQKAEEIIDQIAGLNDKAMLVLTGGEPLLRDDLPEIISHASGKGLTVVLGTNATLLDAEMAMRLKSAGLAGAGLSIDSVTKEKHDALRGVDGCFDTAMRGIDILKSASIPFQIQFTITRENRRELDAVAELAKKSGALALNLFFLVCTGRGQEMTDLNADEYEETLREIALLQARYESGIMIRARCAPHFLRVLKEMPSETGIGAGTVSPWAQTSGCIAGRGYLRISPEGYVTPCPYMPPPADSEDNLNKSSLSDIWFNSKLFKKLRAPSYEGKCSECEHQKLCGGCRARALGSGNTVMGSDPWCAHEPRPGPAPVSAENTASDALWSDEAKERLEKAPAFVREMIKDGVEQYARAIGAEIITPELMAKLKERTGR